MKNKNSQIMKFLKHIKMKENIICGYINNY